MAERIVIRQKGSLCNLTTPQGSMRLLGAATTTGELILEEHDSPPAEFPDCEFLSHMIAIAQGGVPCSIFWKEQGVEKQSAVRPGTVFLSTAKSQTGFRWDGRFQTVVLSIDTLTMERALPEPFTKPPVELITLRAGERDPILEHLIAALSDEFEKRESSNRLFLESLANTTAFYLAQRYGIVPHQSKVYQSGLTRDRMKRVLDYIETYLAEDLSVIELSHIACLSPYHFGKMFKCSMGTSVHQYVLRRRIERAKSMLLSRKLPLSEIALVVGFQDQSQFTTIFRRHVGVTPGAYLRTYSFQ
jgi:AraC family transcriptional regulator